MRPRLRAREHSSNVLNRQENPIPVNPIVTLVNRLRAVVSLEVE